MSCFVFYHKRKLFQQSRPNVFFAVRAVDSAVLKRRRRRRPNKLQPQFVLLNLCTRNKLSVL